MKITGENYQKLDGAIRSVIKTHGEKSHTYKQHSLSFTRYCWDLFWASKFKIGDGIGISGDINISGCNDDHIQTALKKIVKDYGVEPW